MKRWMSRHAQAALGTLGGLSRNRLGTLLTVAVIGVALALPASLYVLVSNAQRIADGWQDIRDFSVYLKPGTPLQAAEGLAGEVGAVDGVAGVTLVSAEQALEELREDTGLSSVVMALDENPLPHTLVIRPDETLGDEAILALADSLAERDIVDLVQLDTEWLARLASIFELVRRAAVLAAVLLGIAVVVIVGNTIRLDIQNRRQEIEVSKLLGATDAFVRRPFLYIGAWYGLFGGLLALLLLVAGLWILGGPAQRLTELYGGEIHLTGINARSAWTVLLGGLAAGWIGAFVAVSRHLSAIQPRV